MKINYLVRTKGTKLYPEIRPWIDANRGRISRGARVLKSFAWPEPGYSARNLLIVIDAPTDNEFQTSSAGDDPTRFPARIRALATALRDAGLPGVYCVSHEWGEIVLRRVLVQAASTTGGGTLHIPEIPGELDDFFDKLRDVLGDALAKGMRIDEIIFRGGGDIVILDWFRDWCRKHDIKITILPPEDFDRDLIDRDGSSGAEGTAPRAGEG